MLNIIAPLNNFKSEIVSVSGIKVFENYKTYLMSEAPADHYFIKCSKVYRKDGDALLGVSVAEGNDDVDKLTNLRNKLTTNPIFTITNVKLFQCSAIKSLVETIEKNIVARVQVPIVIWAPVISETNCRCFEIKICNKIIIVVS